MMKYSDQTWDEIIKTIEEFVRINENNSLPEELNEFKSIRRIDKKATEYREEILRKNRDSKKLDRELSEANPERVLLERREIAIEMASSIAKLVIELPDILNRTESIISESSSYEEPVSVEWREEVETTLSQPNSLKLMMIDIDNEIIEAAQSVLQIIEAGEKEGWQD